MTEIYSYTCKKFQSVSDDVWRDISSIQLVDTVSGNRSRLDTKVKVCWTTEFVCFRFECEDDYIVANYKQRDEPLYLEDVVEIFIDEVGDGRHYKEFEVSPHNVLFDGLIDNDLAGSILLNKEWDAEGIMIDVCKVSENNYVYTINIPHEVFSHPPKSGIEWRVNFYRIDDDREGNRHYWAWSPTEQLYFHVPSKFGRLVFD